MKVLTFHLSSSDPIPVEKERAPPYYLQRWRSWLPTQSSLTSPTSVGSLGWFVITLWGWKSRFPSLPLMMWLGERLQFLLWYLTGVKGLVSTSFCLTRLPWSRVWQERADFRWGFVVCSHWCFSFPACVVSCLRCRRQKENSGNSPPCHSLSPKIPSQSAFFYPHFRLFLCLFYL